MPAAAALPPTAPTAGATDPSSMAKNAASGMAQDQMNKAMPATAAQADTAAPSASAAPALPTADALKGSATTALIKSAE